MDLNLLVFLLELECFMLFCRIRTVTRTKCHVGRATIYLLSISRRIFLSSTQDNEITSRCPSGYGPVQNEIILFVQR